MVALFGVSLVVGMLLSTVVLDATAYLVAAARAQTAADTAALAAATIAHPNGGRRGDPRAEAALIAREGGARLTGCACARGSEQVEVTVAVDVPALVIPRFAAREVTAVATATLVPP